MSTTCFNTIKLKLPQSPFSKTKIYNRALVPFTKVRASRRDDAHDHRLVDESMIVLRMRIEEMKMAESGEATSEWMEWEKKYYPNYNSDVVQVVGMLQSYLMNTRPSVALAMVLVVMLSFSTSVAVVGLNFVEIVKGVLSELHHLG